MKDRQHFESTIYARVRSQTLPSSFRRLIGRTIRWPCPMMTTAPNAHVAKVHDRQVVTRGPDQFSAWLDGTAGTEILPRSRRCDPLLACLETDQQREGAPRGQ